MKDVLDSVAFSAGGRDYLWGEVVRAPLNAGDWSGLQARARESLSRLAWADAQEEDPVDSAELDQSMDEFRYARDLVAAEEMEKWLDFWGLDEDAWLGFVRASLLRAQEREAPLTGPVLTEAELQRATLTEAICSGQLFELGSRLAGRVAVFERARQKGAVTAPVGVAALDFDEIERVFDQFQARVVTAEAVESRIRIRRSDWTQVTRRMLLTPREEVAREVLLAVRDDGRALEEVAAEAGVELDDATALLAEFNAAERDLLQAARSGELLGPFAHEGAFGLILVVERTPPDPEDADLHARARREILHDAVKREVEDRVAWR